MYRNSMTWRSNATMETVFNCPVTRQEIKRLPDKDSENLNSWYFYGLNADLPNRIAGGDLRSGRTFNLSILHTMSRTTSSDAAATNSPVGKS